MSIAIYVKFGNIEKYFQSNKDLFRKIKSSLSNLFRKDVDFLIDLMTSNETCSTDYEKNPRKRISYKLKICCN